MARKFVVGVVLALLIGAIGGWAVRGVVKPPPTHVVIEQPDGGWGSAAGTRPVHIVIDGQVQTCSGVIDC